MRAVPARVGMPCWLSLGLALVTISLWADTCLWPWDSGLGVTRELQGRTRFLPGSGAEEDTTTFDPSRSNSQFDPSRSNNQLVTSRSSTSFDHSRSRFEFIVHENQFVMQEPLGSLEEPQKAAAAPSSPYLPRHRHITAGHQLEARQPHGGLEQSTGSTKMLARSSSQPTRGSRRG